MRTKDRRQVPPVRLGISINLVSCASHIGPDDLSVNDTNHPSPNYSGLQGNQPKQHPKKSKTKQKQRKINPSDTKQETSGVTITPASNNFKFPTSLNSLSLAKSDGLHDSRFNSSSFPQTTNTTKKQRQQQHASLKQVQAFNKLR